MDVADSLHVGGEHIFPLCGFLNYRAASEPQLICMNYMSSAVLVLVLIVNVVSKHCVRFWLIDVDGRLLARIPAFPSMRTCYQTLPSEC